MKTGAAERPIAPAGFDTIDEWSINRASSDASGEQDNQHVAGLGKTLFVDHVVSVEVIGLLLLAAVVGAVLIAGHKVDAGRNEEIVEKCLAAKRL